MRRVRNFDLLITILGAWVGLAVSVTLFLTSDELWRHNQIKDNSLTVLTVFAAFLAFWSVLQITTFVFFALVAPLSPLRQWLLVTIAVMQCATTVFMTFYLATPPHHSIISDKLTGNLEKIAPGPFPPVFIVALIASLTLTLAISFWKVLVIGFASLSFDVFRDAFRRSRVVKTKQLDLSKMTPLRIAAQAVEVNGLSTTASRPDFRVAKRAYKHHLLRKTISDKLLARYQADAALMKGNDVSPTQLQSLNSRRRKGGR